VVVLRIVLEDFGLLFVVKISYKVIHSELLPPFLAIYEPASSLAFDVNVFEGVKPHICFARPTLNFLARRNLSC
jgi:hypothetical protein